MAIPCPARWTWANIWAPRGRRSATRSAGLCDALPGQLPRLGRRSRSGYPEPKMFGEIPAYGFFLRHIKGIELNDVEVSFLKEDLRPAFRLENVKDVEFNHVKAQHAANVPTFVLNGVENFLVQASP